MSGEQHGDHPACVCDVLGAALRSANDRLPDAERQKLKPYLRMVIGTAGDGYREQRLWIGVDWLVRELLPLCLDYLQEPQLAAELGKTGAIHGFESLDFL